MRVDTKLSVVTDLVEDDELDVTPPGEFAADARRLARLAAFPAEMLEICLRWVDLDAVPRIIVDASFRVLWQNRPSLEFLESRQLLVEAQGVLRSLHPPAEDLMRAGGRSATRDLSHICLPTELGGHVLMRFRHIESEGSAPVLGLSYNLCEQTQRPEYANLVQAFGLTNAEQQVALLLMNGLVAERIATRLQISIETVRSHIRKAYQKMQVGSREELFAKLVTYRVR